MFTIKYLEKKALKQLFKQISPIGSYHFFIIIIFIFLSLGDFVNFFKLSFGIIIMYLIAIPIRILFFKERPTPKPKPNNLLQKIDAASMPSMHSSRSLFLLLFLIQFFEYKKIISIFLIFICSLTLYSRIYLKKHYLIDVLAGASLGLFVWTLLNI